MPDPNYWLFSWAPFTTATTDFALGETGLSEINDGSSFWNIEVHSGHTVINLRNNDYFTKSMPNGATDTYTIGFRFMQFDSQGVLDSKELFLMRDAAGASMLNLMTESGTHELVLRRGTTELGRTLNAVPILEVVFIELSVVHHQTAGSVTMHVNGTEQFTVSGIDTTNTANTDCASFRWQAPTTNSNQYYFGDTYIIAGQADDFQAPCVIDISYPSADASPNQFDLVGAAGDHFDAVNDVPADPDVGLETSVAAEVEAFTYQSLTTPGTPKLVALWTLSSRPNSGSGTLAHTLTSAGTPEAGSAFTPGDPDPRLNVDVYPTDPDTAAPWANAAAVEAAVGSITSG